MIPQILTDLCVENGIPADNWSTHSLAPTPVQIFDREGYKALVEPDINAVAIYDLSVSRLFPVVDTGGNLTMRGLMAKNSWNMITTDRGYRVAECFQGAV